MLVLPDPKLPFTITMDVSNFAIGAVLRQNHSKGDQPVIYESRKLNHAEQNYPIHEKELLAIIHVIRLWKSYLEGQKFMVITDHASLEYIKTQHNLSKRQAQWLETLQANDFIIKYKPGKDNIVADALSRPQQANNITTITTQLIKGEKL